jgi:predicted Zn-dependent protease
MQQRTRDGGVPPFLATHPSNAQRIEKLLERLDKNAAR